MNMKTKLFVVTVAALAVMGAEKNRDGGVGKKSRGASSNLTTVSQGGASGLSEGHGGSGIIGGGTHGKTVIAASGGSTNGRA